MFVYFYDAFIKYAVAAPGNIFKQMDPKLETKIEYSFLRRIGADMVGMSTLPEVIVANHIGMASAAVSVIINEYDPDNLQPVNIAEIKALPDKAHDKLVIFF